MDEKKYAVVIGAANIDIGGTPYKPLIQGDSNPGVIKMSYGGVARNIAHNLTMLGVDVEFVTAAGDDTLGMEMLKRCEGTGMDTSLSVVVPGGSSSVYLFINDEKGEMELALSHVDIVKHITPEYIESISDVINSAAVVVADCNLSQETILKLKEICKVPIYMDTVSVSHADKIKGHLDGIDTLKPNLLEAEFLTDMIIESEYDCLEAARAIINQGVRRVFISMGPHGMIAADKDHAIMVDRYPVTVRCTTGAGDSAMAAIVWSSLNEEGDVLTAPAKAANAAASATISVDATIHPEMSSDLIKKKIKEHSITIHEIEAYREGEY
ncbi:MAG: bifunctional hydroxymethylpyrimidine kinase/phosphomethylpyrimidine kinase [Mogibacterium sp.]|nr:bifunctional hydroxymethylpyrimidine kinase/phosphomethylpyrimidine kinase [Mogibacterium sp.]